jgi:hypothetical protein
MSATPAYIAFKIACEISPVILTNGIATALGGALPILLLTESTASALSGIASSGANPIAGLLNSVGNSLSLTGIDQQLDSFFAHFMPLPGASLINNQISMYPFANQQVAANAIIAQPLTVSLKMICPVRGDAGYPIKLSIMSSLQKSLTQHNSIGGTYSVVMPSYIYANCIMTGMRDISSGESKQSQYVWQLDFTQPLVTQQAATQALNSLMQSLTNGTQPSTGIPTSPTGLQVGNPTSLVTSGLGTGPL